MITVDPVLETHDAAGFTAWPIGAPPEDHFLALSGRMSPADVGTAMAVVFEYNGIPVTHLTDARLHRHLAETEGLLTTAQQHLSGFLDLARHWAATTPDAATRLISALDQHLEITADQRV